MVVMCISLHELKKYLKIALGYKFNFFSKRSTSQELFFNNIALHNANASDLI